MVEKEIEKKIEKDTRKGTDSELIDEAEYHSMVAEFDLLWNRTTTPQEQSRMECMIRLIEAFENSRNGRR